MKLEIDEIKAILKESIPPGLVVPDHNEEGHFYVHTPTQTRCASVTTKSGILDMPHLKKWAASEAVKFINKHWDEITKENKAGFFEQAVLAHQDLFEESGQVGTDGHAVVEAYLKKWMETGSQPPDIRAFISSNDARIYAIARSAEMFFNDFEITPLASELRIFHTQYKYGGTLDALAVCHKEINRGASISPFSKEFNGGHHVHQYMLLSKTHNHHECVACGRVIQKRFALLDFKTSNSIEKVEYPMQTAAYDRALRHMTKNRLKPDDLIVIRFDKEKAKYDAMLVSDPAKAFSAFRYCTKIHDWLHNGKEKMIPMKPKTRIVLTPQSPKEIPNGMEEV